MISEINSRFRDIWLPLWDGGRSTNKSKVTVSGRTDFLFGRWMCTSFFTPVTPTLVSLKKEGASRDCTSGKSTDFIGATKVPNALLSQIRFLFTQICKNRINKEGFVILI
jgi:hypothetical protein